MGKVEVVFLLEEIRVQRFILRVCVPSICGLFNRESSILKVLTYTTEDSTEAWMMWKS